MFYSAKAAWYARARSAFTRVRALGRVGTDEAGGARLGRGGVGAQDARGGSGLLADVPHRARHGVVHRADGLRQHVARAREARADRGFVHAEAVPRGGLAELVAAREQPRVRRAIEAPRDLKVAERDRERAELLPDVRGVVWGHCSTA